MLIIAGHLLVDPSSRDVCLAVAGRATALAREVPGCLEFVQAPDPLVPGRIVVLERWESEEQLLAFRRSGAGSDADPSPEPLPELLGAKVLR